MLTRRNEAGFTLTELAVVFMIVALLLGGAMMTFNAQVETRNQDETLRRLNAAAEALIAYAIVNRRLPCPGAATGDMSEVTAGVGDCTNAWNGVLPARTIGFQPVDNAGRGVDVWNNPIRYAVSTMITGCTGSSTTPHFTNMTNLRANGISCRPNDLDVCASSVGTNATSCNTAARIASSETVAFIVWSTGKNGAIGGAQGADENENTDGDRVFVSRTHSDTSATAGTYDDLMVIVPVGMLYSRLISAGVLP